MILVLGGTVDGREIARALRAAGYAVLLTAVTGYGGALAAEDAGEVRIGALDEASLTTLLHDVDTVIDATHPFATAISQMAITVCARQGVPYLRFERPESALPAHVHRVDNAEAAAHRAVALAEGGTIFLTVGSKTLAAYLSPAREAGCRVVTRVLPTAGVLAECERLGLPPKDIFAMQGPVTTAVETALLRFYDARVLVTKESGPTGGVEEKLAAAAAVGIPVVVVGRPRVAYPRVVRDLDGLRAVLLEHKGHEGTKTQKD